MDTCIKHTILFMHYNFQAFIYCLYSYSKFGGVLMPNTYIGTTHLLLINSVVFTNKKITDFTLRITRKTPPNCEELYLGLTDEWKIERYSS